LKVKD